ncbi:asparaginase domain-containing protein [Nocardia sp. NPDC005998]|uniref:asparaginase domain-containing protein n=1 Tax=Nocardia sp. NPDC005998 TaxID=3156894 RepID=UPI0033B554EE
MSARELPVATAPQLLSPVTVDILYTGGTFGMVDHGAGLRPRRGLGSEIADVVTQFERTSGIAVQFEYTELEQVIDSADAGAGTACRIAEQVRSGIARRRPDGVIVVHGTDTMAYVGARMAFELHDLNVPVVLTGAQIPLGRPGSDAGSNLSLALNHIAAQPVPGTCIAFGTSLHPAVRASKRACDHYDGFTTVREFTPPPTPPRLPERRPRADSPPVGLFAVFPGMDPDLLDAALRHYRGGLVLECYGSGTLPQHGDATSAAIRAATTRGTPVVVITHCDSGTVDLDRYQPGRALRAAGAIGGGDMTREAALAKLAYLVDLGISGSGLRRWMTANLLGELSNHHATQSIPNPTHN